MKYVIIGNGAAGMDAAIAIRGIDSEGEIKIFSRETYPHYFRPRLVEFIGEDMPVEKLYVYKNEFLDNLRIEQHCGVTISAINKEEKTISDALGKKYFYDRLLFATGANPRLPQISGSGASGVFVLRNIDDALKIRACGCEKLSMAISGGGLLGLESAYSLIRSGKRVTVIEAMDYLLPRQLDSFGARHLENLLKEKGFDFIFSDTVLSVDAGTITLASGRVISADSLIVSAGIVPETSLAVSAGISAAKGIVINEYMMSSAEDIYAAGDCAEFAGSLCGLWMLAKEQGRIAGENMAGAQKAYSGSTPASALKITGIDMLSFGNFDDDGAEIFRKDSDKTYIRLNCRGENPVGGIVIGDAAAVKDMRAIVAGKMGVKDFISKHL